LKANGTTTTLTEARWRLAGQPEALPADERRRLVTAIADAFLCGGAAEEPMATELIDLLARDADWTVRLEVARMVHLLDDEACSRYVALFRGDCNSYVRGHAERSLSRQRKARQTSSRKRNESRDYAEGLDELARQHGPRVAAKVQSLADQRYAMLSSAVAHDVRSILTTLSANAAALAAEHGSGGRVGSIREDIDLLKRTIEAMEQFTKQLPVQRHPEDLRQMIDQAVEKAREGLIAQRHDPAAVEMAVAPVPTIQLRVSRRLIVLALTNIIENALESFADREADRLRPGRVEVRVAVDGDEARLTVPDNGPGIEPEVLRALRSFAPTGPNKNKRSSSGWGLSLVHRYVTTHRGSVTIDSEIGRGTSVVVTLPMRDVAEGGGE